MPVAVSPVGDIGPVGIGALFVALVSFLLLLVVVVVTHRRNRREQPMPKDEQAKAEANRQRHKSLAKYYLWAAAVGVVLLVLIGILALLDK